MKTSQSEKCIFLMHSGLLDCLGFRKGSMVGSRHEGKTNKIP